jgi:sRNA-binding carbon storage regulator CsrA
VNREEIYQRIQEENKAASASGDASVKSIADAFRKKKQ